ncbi:MULTISPECIES: SDR family oxidoreductase [unclassified Aureimonas]|uniref:SDR family oxidoreductase n=1 Tax=unclassified Aureimonas TaxID=2615206 RepID=UPI0006F7B297|nr:MULTISPECIES: SDR family oxidoreductase [unclassified Aureimonas]KQT66025.1 3-oxoacyl-ACP reductase [Aureimonas sp. Leaf427]KQT73383.1 3-oxoacyl-ACP reductase [Aureimonas sp. Leaf460]
MANESGTAAKVAVVTGGGTGIGKAMTRALAVAGWTVAITGRRREVLEATASELSAETGRTIAAISADIGDDASVEALFAGVIERFGRLDLLVNNAGVNAPPKPLEEVTAAEWNTVVAANLTGVFLCTKEAVKLFKRQSPQGGRIINNGSISATTPRPNSAPYAATKHGVSGLTKATSLEGRRFDIACGQIDIGNAASEMTTTIQKGVLQADGSTIAPEATIDPKIVADAVVYMAGLPLDANVLTMTVMANKMPFVGRG